MPTRVLPRTIPGTPVPPPVIIPPTEPIEEPPPPQTVPPPPPPLSPPPSHPPKLGAPTGKITGPFQIPKPSGADWSKVNRWDDLFVAAGEKHDVPPAMLKAMAIIESGGEMIANQGGSGAFGIMQIKSSIWKARADKLGYDLTTPAGQIGMAGAILGGDATGVKGTTPEERFLSTYYPTASLDTPGEDGHTPRQYLADMHELMRQIEAAGGTTPPAPQPEPPRDIVEIIVGGRPTDDRYGWMHPTDLPFYEYFETHGGDDHHHPGIDATTVLGQTLYSPIAGTVVCSGTGKGPGAWGTGCAAFGDIMGNRAGRIEILDESGQYSLILGHCSDALVAHGQRVDPRDPIARAGGYNGLHVHIERRRHTGGAQVYVIEDPRLFNTPGTKPIELPELPPFTWIDTPNKMSRQGRQPLALVMHVTDDMNFDNVKNWFRNPTSQASSHWVIDRDGGAYQFVGSALASFTNGKVEKPRMDIPWVAARAADFRAGRQNANWYTISFEYVGKPDTPFTGEQIQTGVALGKYYLAAYPTIQHNRSGIMRHADLDSVDRPDRPGNLFPMREYMMALGCDPDAMA